MAYAAIYVSSSAFIMIIDFLDVNNVIHFCLFRDRVHYSESKFSAL